MTIKEWFEPLIWIASTIITLAAFVGVCKPVREFLSSPLKTQKELKQISSDLRTLKTDLSSLQTLNEKQEAIQLSLLHDSILQIYNVARNHGVLHTSEYQRACALYKENGKSEYIDSVMELLEEMYKKGQHQDG